MDKKDNGNTGIYNTGIYNTGNGNTGHWNTGDNNTGYYNTGDRNTGDCNTGHCNIGDANTGHWNIGNGSNGCFCTKPSKIYLFNIQSDMTLEEFNESRYFKALYSAPLELTEWVKEDGGYLKTYIYREACQNWWDDLTDENKEIILSIPNFDKDIFFEITGIEV